jgi:acetoacetate decarboxylase
VKINIVGKDITVVAYLTACNRLMAQERQLSTEEGSRIRPRENFPISLTIPSSRHTTPYRIMRISKTFGKYTNSGTVGKYTNSGTVGKYTNSGTVVKCTNSGTVSKYTNSGTVGKYTNSGTVGR